MPEDTLRNDDTSHEFDMVTLYRGGLDGQMEADLIHGVLESNCIYSIVTGTAYPPLGFEVKVAREHLPEARRLVKEAQAEAATKEQ